MSAPEGWPPGAAQPPPATAAIGSAAATGSAAPIGNLPPPGAPTPPLGYQHTAPSPSGYLFGTPAVPPIPPALSARAARSGRAALAAAGTTMLLVACFANQWVMGWLHRHVRTQWIQALVRTGDFAHWTVAPGQAGDRSNRVLTQAFWPTSSGGPALQRFSLGDDANVHFAANIGSAGLLVVAVAVAMAITLWRHGGGFASRFFAAWGAIGLAAAFTGGITAVAFFVAIDSSSSFSYLGAFFEAAGYGVQWTLVMGVPVAFVAAASARPSAARR